MKKMRVFAVNDDVRLERALMQISDFFEIFWQKKMKNCETIEDFKPPLYSGRWWN